MHTRKNQRAFRSLLISTITEKITIIMIILTKTITITHYSLFYVNLPLRLVLEGPLGWRGSLWTGRLEWGIIWPGGEIFIRFIGTIFNQPK